MSNELLKRYGGAVPRYTSYPTAPHFSDAVGEDAYRARLAALPATEPVSLYLHIPYCDTLCWFCGCHTKITRQYEPVRAYVDTLIRELELLATATVGRPHMSHMHWGGGSPTLLVPTDIQRLAKAASDFFPKSSIHEFAVEIDPRETGRDRIEALAQSGLTRASIGIQDFDPVVQKAINRIQGFQETEAVVEALRDCGVRNLNLDLIYGLPYQTLERMLRTISQALLLRPDRIALFGYAHVPWMKAHQRLIPDDALPGPQERLENAKAAAEMLVSAGYRQIGIDHFALPEDPMSQAQDDGILRRNFQGYTTDRAASLLGVGASSIGRLPTLFVQNEASLKSHARLVAEGHLPIARGAILSQQDQVRAAIIERLMCDGTVDVATCCTLFGVDPDSLRDAEDRLNWMEEDGVLTRNGGCITMTDAGRPFLRQVAASFDQYFKPESGRHSTAI